MGEDEHEASAGPRPVDGDALLARRDPLFARQGAGVLLLLLFSIALCSTWSAVQRGPGIDFYQFWAIGQAVHEGTVEDVYAPAARPVLASTFLARAAGDPSARHRAAAKFREQELQAASTPFLYVCYWALQSGDYDADLTRYRLVCLACTLASIAVCCRLLRYAASETWIVLLYACAAFPALRDDLAEGNVNQIQLALLALSILLLSGPRRGWRTVVAGGVLGLAVLFKPNVALAVVLLFGSWALARRWRELGEATIGLAGAAAFAVLSSSLFFGSAACWSSWLTLARDLDQQIDVGVHWGNFALARLARDLTGLELSWWMALAGLVLAGACSFRARGRPAARGERELQVRRHREWLGDALMIALGPVIALLAGTLAWPHYLVLALPLWIFVLRPRTGAALTSARERGMHALLAVAVGLGFSSPLALSMLGVADSLTRALCLASATLLLFLLGLRELLRLARSAESA